MTILIERTWCGPECTVGTLSIDGVAECFTLEDVVRPDPTPETPANEAKVYGQTAIPAGTYNVIITPSKRFKRALPLLENVPGFEGIRIHPGNTAENTEGCILVGKVRSTRSVSESRAAFIALFAKINACLVVGEPVTLTIA